MKLKNVLIVVKDIERSRKYYHDLFGLELVVDNDGNMILTDGLVLQAESYWKEFLKQDIAWKNNSCELYLDGCDMYVTLEPCMMCTGAIINSRIKNIYYATEDPKGGALVSNIKISKIKNINHYPNVSRGTFNKESQELLKKFFKNKR